MDYDLDNMWNYKNQHCTKFWNFNLTQAQNLMRGKQNYWFYQKEIVYCLFAEMQNKNIY